jgi:hypothetical protein
MRMLVLFATVLFGASLIAENATAQATCSRLRDRCAKLSAQSLRYGPWSGCFVAYEHCMRTGVFDTRILRSGHYSGSGLRREGVAKQ